MLRSTFLVALVLCSPTYAQSTTDAPFVLDVQTLCPDCPCRSGDVVLDPETAVKTAKRLASAEAKVEVYEKSPILPWWGIVIVAVVAAGAAAGVTIGIYEAGRRAP